MKHSHFCTVHNEETGGHHKLAQLNAASFVREHMHLFYSLLCRLAQLLASLFLFPTPPPTILSLHSSPLHTVDSTGLRWFTYVKWSEIMK